MKSLILASVLATTSAFPLPNAQITILTSPPPNQKTNSAPSIKSIAHHSDLAQHQQIFDATEANANSIHIDISVKVTSSGKNSNTGLEEIEGGLPKAYTQKVSADFGRLQTAVVRQRDDCLRLEESPSLDVRFLVCRNSLDKWYRPSGALKI